MPRVERPFIRVPWSFREHPKTEELTDAAVGQLVKAWLYCAQNETDGAVTSTQARKLFSPTVLRQLLTVGYIHEDGDGYVMHEYAEHQMTTATRADLREKRAAAGSAGGKAKAQRQPTASKPVASATAKPQQILAEVELEVEEEQEQLQGLELPSSPPATRGGIDGWFDRFWAVYPRKVAKAQADKTFRIAVRKTDPRIIVDGATRYAQDPNLPEDRTKIPHPATWLSGGRWGDEPQPLRPVNGGAPGGRPGMTESVTRTLDRAAALQARADQSQPNPYRTAIA